jgi:hypothetical protein
MISSTCIGARAAARRSVAAAPHMRARERAVETMPA